METTEAKLDLSKVTNAEIGVPAEAIDQLAANERRKQAESFHILKMRLEQHTYSATANKVLGNLDLAKKHEATAQECKDRMEFNIRAMRDLDKKFPNAKKLMVMMYGKEIQDDTEDKRE